ncbi:hypothetical protein MKZ20_08095 [Psychrobacillus sp. FSL K6-2684]|uniref:hypothetical protein n=1 Tax=Psychrobacillus sp. FSL K6-2684 TaxID=2921547 RepID=UPI0030FA7CAC
MNFSIDNSIINQMAIQLAIIIIVMLIAGGAFGLAFKFIKAPQWLLKPVVTLGILVGIYFIFQVIG